MEKATAQGGIETPKFRGSWSIPPVAGVESWKRFPTGELGGLFLDGTGKKEQASNLEMTLRRGGR
jgi:hypothetical protein